MTQVWDCHGAKCNQGARAQRAALAVRDIGPESAG